MEDDSCLIWHCRCVQFRKIYCLFYLLEVLAVAFKKNTQRDCQLHMNFYPVSAGSSSPIWSEVIHPLYSMTLNSSYSETSIRGLPQLQLQQPSPLTYYFVFHHFLGLYMCDIDSSTACVSRGLPTELLFFIPGSQSQYFLLRIIYISQ